MGFDQEFIPGVTIPLPSLATATAEVALDDGAPKEHTRFSIVLHRERGFAIYTAHNIDGATIIPEGIIPRIDRFRFDPIVPSHFQVDDDRGYRNNPWDRGHLVRRRSLHWRNRTTAEQADRESFFWTNIVPQHGNLHDTAWGRIEDWMLTLADTGNKQASVFTGPVFTSADPELLNQPGELPIRIPAGFWKILAIRHQGQLRAAGFLVWQRDFDQLMPVEFDPLLEQVRLTTLEFLSGLSFGDLREADPLRFGVELIDERGRMRQRGGTALSRATVITSHSDIVI